jgi:single-strand DNA-binding protein
MANLNKVLLMGNLTRDPELRYTPSGASICEFGMAVNRTFTTRDGEKRDETLFVDVAMWGRRGEVISEYFSKGKPIFIEGRLKYDSWETPDGRRSRLTVVAENFEFIGGAGGGASQDRGEPRQGGGAQRSGRGARGKQNPPPRQQSSPEEADPEGLDVSDDEIPF